MAEMYDISPDKDKTGIGLYEIGKGLAQVNNPQIWLEQQKMAMENAKAQREEQQKLEGARQAKLEGDLGKLKDHSREADNPYFAKKISDFNQLVQDNIGDYYDKDIRKSSAAAMKIKEAANGLNSDIDYSNNLGKQEVYTDNLVDHNKPLFWDKEVQDWQENKKKSAFGDDKALISAAPTQHINIQKKFNDSYGKIMEHEGVVKGHTELDGYGNPTFIIDQTLKPERLQEFKDKFYSSNEDVQNELKKQITYNKLDDAYKTDNGLDLKKRLSDVLILPETKEKGRTAQKSSAEFNFGLGGKSDTNLDVVNTYNKNNGERGLTIAVPKEGYKGIKVADNENPVDAQKISLYKTPSGEFRASAVVLTQGGKKELDNLNKQNNALDLAIANKSIEANQIPDKNSQAFKDIQTEIQGYQDLKTENQSKMSSLPSTPHEMDFSEAETALKSTHPQLTNKDIKSYFNKTKKELSGGINFGVVGYDNKEKSVPSQTKSPNKPTTDWSKYKR